MCICDVIDHPFSSIGGLAIPCCFFFTKIRGVLLTHVATKLLNMARIWKSQLSGGKFLLVHIDDGQAHSFTFQCCETYLSVSPKFIRNS